MRVERIQGNYISTPVYASTPIMRSSSVVASTPIMGSSAVLASDPIMGFISNYTYEISPHRRLRNIYPTYSFRVPTLFSYVGAVRGVKGRSA